jgi:lipid-A-disaccharide synthase
MTPSHALPPKIMLIVGEPSGDALGAQLMQALKERTGGHVTLIGVGGPEMRREGLQSLYSIAETSLIGLQDVAPQVRRLWRRIRQAADFAAAQQPDAVVLIDSTDFMRWVAGRIRKRAPHLPIIKYVSPQVWGSRPGRAKAMAKLFDHVLCLFPFEPAFYSKVDLAATFVGNPTIDRAPKPGLGAQLRARLGIAPDERVLVMLPGSRSSELRFLWPVFRDAIDQTIAAAGPGQLLIPCVPTVAPQLQAASLAWGRKVHLLHAPEEKWGAFETATVALTKTGTVTTELALTQTPMVSAYRAGRLTGWLARRVMTVKYLNMLNLVLDRPAVPEFLQDDCTAPNLARELVALLKNPAARASQIKDANEALRKLGLGQPPAALQAADAVLSLCRGRRNKG